MVCEGFPQGLCRKWSGRWIADKSPCISPSRCLLCRGVHWQARPSPINGRSIYFYSGWRRENVRSWQGPLLGMIPLSPQQPSFCSSPSSALEGLGQGEGKAGSTPVPENPPCPCTHTHTHTQHTHMWNHTCTLFLSGNLGWGTISLSN